LNKRNKWQPVVNSTAFSAAKIHLVHSEEVLEALELLRVLLPQRTTDRLKRDTLTN
jgi:hypothetical protein